MPLQKNTLEMLPIAGAGDEWQRSACVFVMTRGLCQISPGTVSQGTPGALWHLEQTRPFRRCLQSRPIPPPAIGPKTAEEVGLGIDKAGSWHLDTLI